MSAANKMTETYFTTPTRAPNSHTIVPTIHLTDSPQNNDEFSNTSRTTKRLRGFPRKQYFRPHADNSAFTKCASVSPSPLSSSPDSRSGSPIRLTSRFPVNHVQVTRTGGNIKHQHIGFCPISHGQGLTGDSSDEHSGDSEVESHLNSTGKVQFPLLLHPALRIDKSTNFRRHSCIW